MWQTAIIEDDPAAKETLNGHLEQYALSARTTFDITDFPSGEAFLARERHFDLVFMDIDLPGVNGLLAAKRFRLSDADASIIFVTNMAEYAIEGYSVAAADYMVKPLEYDLFEKKLTRILTARKEKAPKTVLLDVPNGVIQLPVAEIEYIEVMGHRTVIHTTQSTVALRKPITELERIFHPYDFLRCNQCYLINPIHIAAIRDGFVWIGNEKLPISRNRKKDFMAAFAGWAGKYGR